MLERSRDTVDLDKLVRYALQYGSRTLVKRLGWSLERAEVDISVLMPLLEVPSSSYSVLDPGRPRRGERDRRWKLIVSLGAESSRD